jgi:methionyl-tRNA formyltransferase
MLFNLKITQLLNAQMPSPLQLVFCGTPAFAVPTLEQLAKAGFNLQLVVTQPDRPKGRGMELTPSLVKDSALKLGLQIAQPEKIKNNEGFRAHLTALCPDAIIVVGYGRIIPQWMIDLPRLGNINLHASLLPKYRGAAPIQWAIAEGENMTGVTTMRIDAGLDTGDILLQQKEEITLQDTAQTLAPRLAAMGAKLMVETLEGLQAGTIQSRKQEHRDATLAPILTKEDGRIAFSRTAQQIFNRMRGFQPWPGAFTSFREKNLNIWNAKVPQNTYESTANQRHPLQPGEIFVENGQLMIACAENSLLFPLEVQPEGKKRMPIHDFIHGYRPGNGEMLG